MLMLSIYMVDGGFARIYENSKQRYAKTLSRHYYLDCCTRFKPYSLVCNGKVYGPSQIVTLVLR